jgi:hypothetical protein
VTGMKNYPAIICAAVAFVFMAHDDRAATTNAPVPIHTNFVSDAVLTADEVGTIVKLAKKCGISHVAEVRTFHYLPTLVRGIEVTSTDDVDGRNATYETLKVFRKDWSGATVPSAPFAAISLGDFWVNGPGIPELHTATLFNVARETIHVQVGPDIPIETADTIIKAFTTTNIFGTASRTFLSEDLSRPDFLGSAGLENLYWIGFSGSDNRYEFTVTGSKVRITAEVHTSP